MISGTISGRLITMKVAAMPRQGARARRRQRRGCREQVETIVAVTAILIETQAALWKSRSAGHAVPVRLKPWNLVKEELALNEKISSTGNRRVKKDEAQHRDGWKAALMAQVESFAVRPSGFSHGAPASACCRI